LARRCGAIPLIVDLPSSAGVIWQRQLGVVPADYEIGRSQLDRWWPHHVALPAAAVRGLANAATVRGFAASLIAAPLTYPL
jgi:hypothetical protein